MGTINARCAQPDIAETIIIIVRTAHCFTRYLGAPKNFIIKRMTSVSAPQLHSINRSRGGIDQSLDIVFHASFKHIKSTFDVYMKCRSRKSLQCNNHIAARCTTASHPSIASLRVSISRTSPPLG